MKKKLKLRRQTLQDLRRNTLKHAGGAEGEPISNPPYACCPLVQQDKLAD